MKIIYIRILVLLGALLLLLLAKWAYSEPPDPPELNMTHLNRKDDTLYLSNIPAQFKDELPENAGLKLVESIRKLRKLRGE